MKKLVSVFVLLFAIASEAGPSGPSISGGVPSAPRSVLIQSHLSGNSFDEMGRDKALKQAFVDMRAGLVEIVAERGDKSGTREALCIQYISFDEFTKGAKRFRSLLANHTTMEVLDNGQCF